MSHPAEPCHLKWLMAVDTLTIDFFFLMLNKALIFLTRPAFSLIAWTSGQWENFYNYIVTERQSMKIIRTTAICCVFKFYSFFFLLYVKT